MLGTNPLAWAMPSDDPFPFSFDGATCVAPQGKIELYERLGKSAIPEGWVIGEDGNYRTDVARINSDIPLHKAALVPIGGVGEEHGCWCSISRTNGSAPAVPPVRCTSTTV